MVSPRPHRVIVVGRGFGGLQAATPLTTAPVELTLVDRRNFRLFQPLIYVIVGDDDSRAARIDFAHGERIPFGGTRPSLPVVTERATTGSEDSMSGRPEEGPGV
jgi:2-polyprenyl-6-methoxyphenol hydroxylase-like FAD-dependent oxidoreductase